MRKLISLPILLLMSAGISGQDTSYVRYVTDSLASPYMAGRGYTDQGALRAATFIAGELRKTSAVPLAGSYFQEFSYPMNVITGDVHLDIDGIRLAPGNDFVITAFSESVDQTYDLVIIPKSAYRNVRRLAKYLLKNQGPGVVPVIDLALARDDEVRSELKALLYKKPSINISGVLFIQDRQPWYHVSRAGKTVDYFAIQVSRKAWPAEAGQMKLSFDNTFYPSYPTQNVCAFIPGDTHPDSFIVFTAHYDHLGKMGNDVYFPGCNDNASGVAMLLDLARYYSQRGNQPGYSIAFLFFSGEEAGLKGSFHFTGYPLIDLTNIDLVVNFDMVGSGSEGISVINGRVYQDKLKHFRSVNDSKHYVTDIRAGGESANSDHHPFHDKGIASFFIFTRGKEYMEYHTVTDTGPLPLTAYNELFRLIIEATYH